MKAREEMPLLRCALGPTGRPFGDGLHSVTASGTDGRKAVITRNWDMAGSTLKKPIRGRKMGVVASESDFGFGTTATGWVIGLIGSILIAIKWIKPIKAFKRFKRDAKRIKPIKRFKK